jgi:hypothetical protein
VAASGAYTSGVRYLFVVPFLGRARTSPREWGLAYPVGPSPGCGRPSCLAPVPEKNRGPVEATGSAGRGQLLVEGPPSAWVALVDKPGFLLRLLGS